MNSNFSILAKNLSFKWKIAQMWWVIPKASVLKEFHVKDENFEVMMYNNSQFKFSKKEITASLFEDSNQIRTIKVTIHSQKINFSIREMIPMYENGEIDYDRIITSLSATESKSSKGLKILRQGIDAIK